MFGLLLAIIYISFISLGLPDSLLGSAWPLMVEEFSVPLSYMGIISVIISAGTVASSLFSERVTRRIGTGRVTAISVFLTAIGLLGFALSNSFALLCVFAVPYGIGAGAVDASLNNYVAIHYASRQMSWLHCCWGVGASIGPYIMSSAIGMGKGWQMGYGVISGIQLALCLALFLALPLWKKVGDGEGLTEQKSNIGLRGALKIKGVKPAMLAFFCYCALESTAGLWASSYLVDCRGVDAQTAAGFASLFYLGITAGRFASGFFANRVGDKNMVRLGCSVIVLGLALIALPLENSILALVGLVTVGVGAAPIFPSLIHATPTSFGNEASHTVVGMQMASAYVGILMAPMIFGLIADNVNIALYPFFMLTFALALTASTEAVNRIVKSNKSNL